MKVLPIYLSCFFIFCFIATGTGVKAQPNLLPHLEKRGLATQLIVDSKPYLVLGGQMHNPGIVPYDLETVLPQMTAMHLNTILAPVMWSRMEPKEGEFYFGMIDSLIEQSRKSNLHLVVLWFGSFKNASMRCAPPWVQNDHERFPLIKLANGRVSRSISPLSKEAEKADAKAYAALMKHIKEKDASTHTVIMMQMENEVGILGGFREHSAIADEAFAKPVPDELMTALQNHKNELQPALKKLWETSGYKKAGTWEQVFGQSPATDELFTAWCYARYMNEVSQAGKAIYPLPTYVNAWIVQSPYQLPGNYPSGGAQAHVHDIWRFTAPMIDILSPDIYLPVFKEITAIYHHTWNPLFIPEASVDGTASEQAYYSFGHESAIGYSPYDLDRQKGITNVKKALLPETYQQLQALAPLITDAQSKGNINGFILNRANRVEKITMGKYLIEVNLRETRDSLDIVSRGYGIIMNMGDDEFIVSGLNTRFKFVYKNNGQTKLAWVKKGVFIGDGLDYGLINQQHTLPSDNEILLDDAKPQTLKIKLTHLN